MGAASIMQMADRVAAMMEERLGVRGDGLAEKLRRGGGQLPREVRAEAQWLADAMAMADNPKLAARLDQARAAQAYDTCLRHLRQARKWDRRGERAMAVLGQGAVILLATAALAVGLAWWRGLL
jgi:hypothetical protein